MVSMPSFDEIGPNMRAALGIAVLSSISATTTGTRLPADGAALRAALTDGYTMPYLWAGALLLVAAVIAALAVTAVERHRDVTPVA